MQNFITEHSKSVKKINRKITTRSINFDAYLRWQRDIQRSKNLLREFSQAIKDFDLDKDDKILNDDIKIFCSNKTYKPSELLKAEQIEKNHLELLTILAQVARTALQCNVDKQGKGFYEYQSLKGLYKNTAKHLGISSENQLF